MQTCAGKTCWSYRTGSSTMKMSTSQIGFGVPFRKWLRVWGFSCCIFKYRYLKKKKKKRYQPLNYITPEPHSRGACVWPRLQSTEKNSQDERRTDPTRKVQRRLLKSQGRWKRETFWGSGFVDARLSPPQGPKSTDRLAHSRGFTCFFFFLYWPSKETSELPLESAENDGLTLSQRSETAGFADSGMCFAQRNHLQI